MRAAIILAEGFEEIEAFTAIDVLRRAGVEVTVASLSSSIVESSRKIRTMTDKRLAEIKEEGIHHQKKKKEEKEKPEFEGGGIKLSEEEEKKVNQRVEEILHLGKGESGEEAEEGESEGEHEEVESKEEPGQEEEKQ